jgi:DNA-binding LacI/PurR family transcriptional regulator
VAVVGVDDIPPAAIIDPPLTTVALPAWAMGAAAMAHLERAWEGYAGAPEHRLLEVSLVVRASCGRHEA